MRQVLFSFAVTAAVLGIVAFVGAQEFKCKCGSVCYCDAGQCKDDGCPTVRGKTAVERQLQIEKDKDTASRWNEIFKPIEQDANNVKGEAWVRDVKTVRVVEESRAEPWPKHARFKQTTTTEATVSGCSSAATSGGCSGKGKKEKGRFHLFGKRKGGCSG